MKMMMLMMMMIMMMVIITLAPCTRGPASVTRTTSPRQASIFCKIIKKNQPFEKKIAENFAYFQLFSDKRV